MDEVSFLEQLVSIPSPSGEEDAVGEFLIEQMTAMGFRAHRDEIGNAIGIIGNPEARRRVLLLGHMDTVSPDLPVRWQEDLLYGRGTVDAKGPLAVFVLAAAQTAATLSDDCAVIVVGAVEEEDPRGRGAHHLLETMQSPDCVIVGEPSDWEGITLGYKGLLSVDYRWMQAGGHSAGRLPGPAEKAVTFWNWVMNYAEACNHGQEGHFHTLDPALRDFHTVEEGADEGVEMNIVLRLPPGIDIVNLQQWLLDWSNGAELTFVGHEPPYQAQKNTPPVRALLKAIRAEGGRPRFKLKTGTSDMNVVGGVWNCPMVAYGPGDSALDHTPEEHIDVREFKRSINVLAQALEILRRNT